MNEPKNDIERIHSHVSRLIDIESRRVNIIDEQRRRAVQDIKIIEAARVGKIESRAAALVMDRYIQTSVKVGNIIVHHSPGLLGTLSAIYGVLKTIYNAVSWFVTTFKVKEIIQLVDLARTISPKFRAWTDKLLTGLRDFAEQIGLGADAFYHALHAIQGTISATAGMLGKDWDWVDSQYAEKTMELSKRLSYWGKQIQDNPAEFFDDVFVQEKGRELDLQGTTWAKIWNGIEKGVSWGQEALDNTKELTTSLQQLENALPEKVKEFIPDSVWDMVGEVDRVLENVIEPRFNRIEEAMSIVNSAVNTQSDKLSTLAERLALPGDYIQEIDQLDEQLKSLQEQKLDELTAREFNRQAEKQNQETAAIFEQMQKVAEAGITPGRTVNFMGLEPKSNPRPPQGDLGQYETWFVGDY